ncbi:MAG: DUF1697 domain-containing protein [Gemmatimonadaceae bacterium]|jgi:uncharacterized protein (DUF1697 family)|nr:DUF1697 domain-containing protein [Gemmatimonadaceae bacterium]
MPRFVVLLRGVNVGKGNRVPMADFRRILTTLGYTDVATLLASGNAVFSASGRSATTHARAIAAALTAQLDVSVPTIVLRATELTAIVTGNPIVPPAADHSRFLVAFAQEADALGTLAPLATLATAPERLVIGEHAAYLHCARGILESPVAAAMLGRAGRAVTTRNWATVLKLEALASTAA